MKCNSGLSVRTKKRHLDQLADYREQQLRPHPELRTLFIEMTSQCNEYCRHCGSRCGDVSRKAPLSGGEICAFLRKIKADFPIEKLQLCVTGGEPLLRPDFFEIMQEAKRLGFGWGMTSNGTLITPETAHRLAEAGMRTVSVSLDGLKETHEWFRQVPGCYDRAVEGVRNLLAEDAFDHVQITTVVHHRNIGELEALYKTVSAIGVKSWRVINIEPIGRAKEQPELLLTPEEYKKVFDFIREKRFAGSMEVCYGCSHFLGERYEREVRPWYFLCNAGVYTASITSEGDIVSCLDVERRPELVQGNIRRDDFKTVWESGFRIWRSDWRRTGPCRDCEYYRWCAGDSFHTWNFDTMEPNLCLKGILF